jgi:hypothetical protein
MGSNGVDSLPMADEAGGSEATIEIKIKTLDSQTYTLRVDKQVTSIGFFFFFFFGGFFTLKYIL